jgi:peptide/nickel transport system permease protein
MFRTYVLKRVIYGVMMYIIMVTAYSILFNQVADKTLWAAIDEEVAMDIRKFKNLDEDQLALQMEQLRQHKIEKYHLDRPIIERIFWRTVDTLTFNFGNATLMKASNGDRAVKDIILEALPRTILLFTTEILLVILIGVAIGIKMAQKPGKLLDRAVSMVTMVTHGLPSWWLGMLAIMTFAYAIPIFPSGGMHSNPAPEGFANLLDLLHHMALPLLTLTVLGIWGVAYQTRNIVLGNLQEDFVMAARARGIPERKVLYGHTLRSSMPAIMTLAVLSLFASMSGNILVEGIFSWPGLGNLYFTAVQQNDIPVLMGSLAITTLVNMFGFILLDIIYGYLDPRIKVGGKG